MENKEKFEVEEAKAIIMQWLVESSKNDSTTNKPSTYITPEGMAYLNGFLQSNNTINLIKEERYTELLSKHEKLINNYSKLKKELDSIRSNNIYKILKYII